MTSASSFSVSPIWQRCLYAPLLVTPAPDAAVNQNLPVSFFWTPKGFAEGYHLQVSTNASFATLVVDAPDLTESRYTLPSRRRGHALLLAREHVE